MIEVKSIYKGDYYNYIGKCVSVKGDVNISYLGIEELKVQFVYVGGHFMCSHNSLKSLKGCPSVVGGEFICDNNNLKNLIDGPRTVGNNYICSHNELNSLEGCPSLIKGAFNCNFNGLKSLEHCPQTIGSNFLGLYNPLENFKFFPHYIGGNLQSTEDFVEHFDEVDDFYLLGRIHDSRYDKTKLTILENRLKKKNAFMAFNEGFDINGYAQCLKML